MTKADLQKILKRDYPDLDNFLMAMHSVFGKSVVSIRLAGKPVLRNGEVVG